MVWCLVKFRDNFTFTSPYLVIEHLNNAITCRMNAVLSMVEQATTVRGNGNDLKEWINLETCETAPCIMISLRPDHHSILWIRCLHSSRPRKLKYSQPGSGGTTNKQDVFYILHVIRWNTISFAVRMPLIFVIVCKM
jgi:hypothetical protein